MLAVAPEYFTITGGRERWLYRIARKHAGGHGWPGFAIALPTLFEKSGAEGTYRRFKHELKRITEVNDLSEVAFVWEERRGEEPALRMARRSTLHPSDPAFEMPIPGRTARPLVPDRPRIWPNNADLPLSRDASAAVLLADRKRSVLPNP